MLTPFPTQISGAVFLASRRAALLADEPRVGKTGTAIIAADLELAGTILVVTTASGRAVWQRAFGQWSTFGRSVAIMANSADNATADVIIISWAGANNPQMRAKLLARQFDRVILDESHYAKSVETKRTQSVLGAFCDDGATLMVRQSLANTAGGNVWFLTGTPIPNAPNDLYPMLRHSASACLVENTVRGWPDVTTYDNFLKRYTIGRPKRISRFNTIWVVMGGKNERELRERIGDFMLRRTQQDVGIGEPIYDIMPISTTPGMRKQMEAAIDAPLAEVLAAAEAGKTDQLEIHLGTLRRLTGTLKVAGVVEAVDEEFECGLDKIVLAYWHREVGDALQQALAKHGVLRIDGSTSAAARGEIEQQFLTDPKAKVMLGQIAAAGEAVDFSSAALMWFVEPVFIPQQMKQMSLRITNHTQKRQALVRVCVLAKSIDEAVQEILLRKWTTIREVLK